MFSRLQNLLLFLAIILLISLPRFTRLNQYLIVDEADRWHWAEDFVSALSRGDLAGTLVGDGYPGIVPVWAETIWILLEATRRSIVAGQWIGDTGLYLILHEWERSAFLYQQRLPIVLLNTLLALGVIGAVWRLFGRRMALVSAVLVALDPFYLSDSRVNRAEAVLTGLITLSILALIFYYRRPRWRYVFISGILGGLSFLTKIQALAILPAIALIGLFIYSRRGSQCIQFSRSEARPRAERGRTWACWLLKFGSTESEIGSKKAIPSSPLRVPTPYSLLKFGLLWAVAAGLIWVLLWPAMWVNPVETLSLVYDYTTRKVGAEGVNLFFMGQTYADADPGLIFYPFAFLMRITPVTLVGLIFYAFRLISKQARNEGNPAQAFTRQASFILLIYILVYTLVMTVGSHKQDRYLLPIFLGVDILAGLGWVFLWDWLKKRLESKLPPPTSRFASLLPTPYLGGALFAGLLILQLVTILPHHPYYYSFFNPLLGGGATAVRTMRIGWGEGMDQVGAYLAAKPNSRNLVVASRFTHNMLGFKGEQISLLPDGRWTQADYIVLYIQQVQRRQEPSPGFIDYFQGRSPEKVITIAGIDYAWIYPIPFTVPADPQVSIVPDQAALLGYRWEESGQLRLFWENLGLSQPERSLVARLRGETAQSEWAACSPDTPFISQIQMRGSYLESLCAPVIEGLPPGTYNVEFALTTPVKAGDEPEPFNFPQGWQAATVSPAGEVADTPESVRLEAIAASILSPDARRVDRSYDDRIKLLAYHLDPPKPQPGQEVKLSLYWQLLKNGAEPLRLTVQLADSRSLNLGRVDADLITEGRVGGEVISTQHLFNLAAKLERPLATQIEVGLQDGSEIPLRSTNAAGEELGQVIARFTIPPEEEPSLASATPVTGVWQNGLALQGYSLSPQPARPGETLLVNLFWTTNQAVSENYIVFVHLLDEQGQIIAQNDALPRAGAYPVPWWQPGTVIEDIHPLILPPDLSVGVYYLTVGFYLPESGQRLLLAGGEDNLTLGYVEIGGEAKK
jgi:hypothetical protein